VSVLPPFLRAVARFVPASYVFEGMRSVITSGKFPHLALLWSFGLDAAYLLAAFFVFYRVLRVVRKQGLLARIGE